MAKPKLRLLPRHLLQHLLLKLPRHLLPNRHLLLLPLPKQRPLLLLQLLNPQRNKQVLPNKKADASRLFCCQSCNIHKISRQANPSS